MQGFQLLYPGFRISFLNIIDPIVCVTTNWHKILEMPQVCQKEYGKPCRIFKRKFGNGIVQKNEIWTPSNSIDEDSSKASSCRGVRTREFYISYRRVQRTDFLLQSNVPHAIIGTKTKCKSAKDSKTTTFVFSMMNMSHTSVHTSADTVVYV